MAEENRSINSYEDAVEACSNIDAWAASGDIFPLLIEILGGASNINAFSPVCGTDKERAKIINRAGQRICNIALFLRRGPVKKLEVDDE